MKIRRSCAALGTSAAFALLALLAELRLDAGFAAGVLYIVPIVILALYSDPKDVLTMTGAACVLVVAGHALSPAAGSEPWVALANRGLSVLALCAAGALGYRYGKAVAKSAEAERGYRAMFDASADAVLIHSNGELAFANSRALEVLGIESVDNVLGIDPIEFVHTDDRDTAGSRRRQAMNTGQPPPPQEIRYTRADGRVVCLEVQSGRILWRARPAELVIGRDTTNRDQMDRELQRRETLYQAVFNQTFQFVALLDGEGRIREVNDTMREFAGETKDVLIGAELWRVPRWTETPEAGEVLRAAVKAAAHGNFARDEISIHGVAESELTIDFSIKPVRGEGGVVEMLIFEGRDITTQRRQQDMLQHAQKMEAVGELTSGIAHDVNNILMVVAGNLELLQSRRGDEAWIESRIRPAIDAVFRGQSLTHQLLAFSRQQELRPTAVDVNTLVDGMREIFSTLGEAITVDTDLEDGLWPALVDANQIEVVLLNIVINARDAMPGGGGITVSTKNVWLDETYNGKALDLPPGEYIRIDVTDTGAGMTPEVVRHAFEPFFTTKGPDKGTGLGLSMAFGFVKQTGGDIKIYSEEGRGTTVRIYLPKSDRPVEADAAAADTDELHSAQDGRILVVEDDAAVRDIAVGSLRDAGYAVEEAADGDAAAAVLRAGKGFDLLFTDVVLPGDFDGVEVATLGRAHKPSLAVLFTSGYPRRPLEESESSIKGAAFVGKPYRQEQLLDLVQELLARRG